ncbi:MAG: SGNH/GDSL hydrolase family protein [Planctomycetaceae bacterium]
MTAAPSDSRTSVILLGASNLTLSWPRIMSLLQTRFSGMLDVYTAQGMGRSYVCDRSVFGVRHLPGILVSDLWSALTTSIGAGQQSFGLLTDFGNDLVYGRQPDEIIQAADECLRRISRLDPNCHMVVAGPPLESVLSLDWLRFTVSRLLLFPRSRLLLDDIQAKTRDLDQGIREVAQRWNASLLEPKLDWYGSDPIHYRWRYQATAFDEMMKLWPGVSSGPAGRILKSRPTPAMRWVFGKERRVVQPVLVSDRVRVHAW